MNHNVLTQCPDKTEMTRQWLRLTGHVKQYVHYTGLIYANSGPRDQELETREPTGTRFHNPLLHIHVTVSFHI